MKAQRLHIYSMIQGVVKHPSYHTKINTVPDKGFNRGF